MSLYGTRFFELYNLEHWSLSLNTATLLSYTKDFDNLYAYTGNDLGVTYTETQSFFKLWSPTATAVVLKLYTFSLSDKKYTEYTAISMKSGLQGVWYTEVSGNLDGIYYDYEIHYEAETVLCADPYATACGCNGDKSMVVDLRRTDPPHFHQDKAPLPSKEQIIYELHIKDFSYDLESGIPQEYRGKYKAFTIENPSQKYPTGIAYLKELGVTHVHLLPFYDFGSIDEGGSPDQFNWGYDPVNYNVPEGSYATDPYDGAVRIRECKEMIQALHHAGIRVVMDVVYNHTYAADSWLERSAPGYFCRRWPDGSLSNGSGCGNDMAAGRLMADNYIVNSLKYWAKEYHIDGFRFDLMGLLTTELMNRIRKEMDEEFGVGEILLYGEPWSAGDSPMEEGTHAAKKNNLPLLDEGVAVFSDDSRDVIKGDVFHPQAVGFVNGGTHAEHAILQAVTGWRNTDRDIHPKSCSQIVQYVSAHDNFTLWDKLALSVCSSQEISHILSGTETDKERFFGKTENILALNKLCALIYFTCQGHIFFQAGEEFGRTKLGDDNSYCSPASVNMLSWQRSQDFNHLVSYYKGLIALRKTLPGLYDKSPEAYKRISRETVHGTGIVSFVIDNTELHTPNTEDLEASPWKTLCIAYNASEQQVSIQLPEENTSATSEAHSHSQWTVLADGTQTNCRLPLQVGIKEITIPQKSGIILGKE